MDNDPLSKAYYRREYEALQAKCGRYERALNRIANRQKPNVGGMLSGVESADIAREALNHKESQ